MHPRLFLAFVLLLCLANRAAAEDESPDRTADLIVWVGILIDVPGERVKENYSILVNDGRIMETRPGFARISGAKILDLSTQTVLPGLIDSHVHLLAVLSARGNNEMIRMTPSELALRGTVNARKTLLAGFTSIQDVGSRSSEAIFALRDAIARGDVIGPRIRASGTPIAIAGGHDDYRTGYPEYLWSALDEGNVCNGADDCRRAAREQIIRGADLIKISATGGVLSPAATGVGKQFSNPELEAIVDASRSMGRYVTAHAHGTDGINAALDAGVHSIEHGTYLDDSSIKKFRASGAYLVPTALAAATIMQWANDPNSWMSEAQKKKALAVGPILISSVGNAHNKGVKIAFGTDTGVSPHGENAREFQLLVDAGLSPIEAIMTATVNAAAHLEMSDQIGTLEPGKYADFIAVSGDPRSDINTLLDVSVVVKGGILYKGASYLVVDD